MLLWANGIDDVISLARMIGKSRQATSDVLYGNKVFPSVRRAIALVLNKTVEELWPENGHKKAA